MSLVCGARLEKLVRRNTSALLLRTRFIANPQDTATGEGLRASRGGSYNTISLVAENKMEDVAFENYKRVGFIISSQMRLRGFCVNAHGNFIIASDGIQ